MVGETRPQPCASFPQQRQLAGFVGEPRGGDGSHPMLQGRASSLGARAGLPAGKCILEPSSPAAASCRTIRGLPRDSSAWFCLGSFLPEVCPDPTPSCPWAQPWDSPCPRPFFPFPASPAGGAPGHSTPSTAHCRSRDLLGAGPGQRGGGCVPVARTELSRISVATETETCSRKGKLCPRPSCGACRRQAIAVSLASVLLSCPSFPSTLPKTQWGKCIHLFPYLG